MRTRIDCCAKDCPDRQADPNCHGYCQRYLEQKAEFDEAMAAAREKRRLESDITGTLVRRCDKMNRRRRTHTKYGR